MNDFVEPSDAKLFLLRNAGVFDPLLTEIVTLPVRLAGPHKLRQRFGKRAVAALTDGQRLQGIVDLELAAPRPQCRTYRAHQRRRCNGPFQQGQIA